MNVGPQDCRSEQGVLVGLIDGMIAQARVIARSLRDGLLPGAALGDALADLGTRAVATGRQRQRSWGCCESL